LPLWAACARLACGLCEWIVENAFIVGAAQPIMAEFLETFVEYPPRQKAASFTIDQALDRMQGALNTNH
jgi:arylsulfatase